MRNRIISKTIASKVLRIGIQYYVVRSGRNKESIVDKRLCRAEVEYEYQIATHICKNLIGIVVPYLHYRLVLYVLLKLKCSEHRLVEIAKIVIVEFGVVYKIPLATCILIAPSVALTREVNPFGMAELITHKVEIATIDGRCRNETYHLRPNDGWSPPRI